MPALPSPSRHSCPAARRSHASLLLVGSLFQSSSALNVFNVTERGRYSPPETGVRNGVATLSIEGMGACVPCLLHCYCCFPAAASLLLLQPLLNSKTARGPGEWIRLCWRCVHQHRPAHQHPSTIRHPHRCPCASCPHSPLTRDRTDIKVDEVLGLVGDIGAWGKGRGGRATW